jgi:hypothetical protein
VGTFVASESGSGAGNFVLKIDGKTRSFFWNRGTKFNNFADYNRAYTVGAEWRIVYSEARNIDSEPYLWSITFTGNVLLSSTTKPTGNARPEQVDWATFWSEFRSAVQKRDRKALALLMTNPFEAVSAGLYTPAQWLKELDSSGGWKGMEISIKAGIKPNGSRKGLPSKISRNNYLIFALGKDGKWRWTAVGGD